jgi:hypothetical protein
VPEARPQPGSDDSSARYGDHEAEANENPAAAVHAPVVRYDSQGRSARRTRFFLAEREIPWLPVSEPAFLLWVLALFVVVWLSIGVILELT